MKKIFFSKNKKTKNFFFEFNLQDPKILNEDNLKKIQSLLVCKKNWNDKKSINREYHYLNKFVYLKFKQICKNLNIVHKTEYSKKYWQIIIFPWLTNLTFVLFDRWNSLNYFKNKRDYNFESFKLYDNLFIPEKSKDLNYNNDNINYFIYSKLLNHFKLKKFTSQKKIFLEKKSSSISLSKKILVNLYKFFSKFYKINFFIKNIGVSNYDFLKLNLYLNQFPFFWFEPIINKTNNANIKLRESLIKKKNKYTDNFEHFFDSIFYIFLPKSYLENFSLIKNYINESYWPKRCKKILTGLDYIKNDIFQIWCAEMVQKKAKYFIIQHGGNIGSAKYQIDELIQKKVADYFLTWGWKDSNIKVKKFYPISLNIQKKFLKKNNQILVVFNFYGKFSNRINSIPKTNLHRLTKILQLKTLIENLSVNLPIFIRYQKTEEAHHNFKFNKNYFNINNVKYDTCEINFKKKILKDAQLVIHDSDSTTFLESMFLNVPTILILNKRIEKFRTSSISEYKNLEENNILFYNPIKASNFINKNINFIMDWWNSRQIQKTRLDFCSKYARRTQNIYYKIKNL